jgi:hypothetical protein
MAKKNAAKRSARTSKTTGRAGPRGRASLKPRTGQPGTVRADFNQPGKVAIERMPDPQRGIARALDRAIRGAVPGATSVVKWGNACYFLDGRAFASLIATRRGVNLALPGTKIADPNGLLEGTGKTMRHVKVADAVLARSDSVRALIVAAAAVGLDGM